VTTTPNFIHENIPLARYTTLGVGGRAKYFATITSADQLNDLNNWIIQHGKALEFFVLGGGSNVIFSDKGFDGLVIKNKIKIFSYSDSTCQIGAGNSMSEIVDFATKQGIKGFEWAAGLPGTVGGAIYGNAGCYHGQIWDHLKSISYFEINETSGKKIEIKVKPNMFGYRQSIFKSELANIIVSAQLKIKRAPRDKEAVKQKMRLVLKKRQESNPKEKSVGCFFKNPEILGKEFSAGKLIEEAGLKGRRVGGAMVSKKHANFLVNSPDHGQTATAEDFIKLIEIIKVDVKFKLGVLLEEEIIKVGKF